MPKAIAVPVVKPKSAPNLHSVKPTLKSGAKTSKPVITTEKKSMRMAAKQPQTRKKSNGALSEAERRNYVEVAAYYIAQGRGFCGGCELEDWIQAEAEVDRMLK